MNDARARRFPLLGLVAGILALAGLVGALLLLDRAEGMTTTGEITLPEEIGGLTALDLQDDPSAEDVRASFDYNDERLSEALDGAAAASRVYTDDEGRAVRVVAYRVESGPLLPLAFEDPETAQSGYVEDLESHGDVECLLTRMTEMGAEMQSMQGGESEAGQVLGGYCRRTAPGLTVLMQLQDVEVDDVVGWVDEIFTDNA